MSDSREAAINLRRIWRAHDEGDEKKGREAASSLFQILGATPENAREAGLYAIQAYFCADEAEGYQGSDPKREDFWYGEAKRLLTKAREICGFETESPKHTIRWWKAYRHKDMEGVIQGLIDEHEAQFKHLDKSKRERYAKACVDKLITAGKAHDIKNWEAVDDILTEYFNIYFDAYLKT